MLAYAPQQGARMAEGRRAIAPNLSSRPGPQLPNRAEHAGRQPAHGQQAYLGATQVSFLAASVSDTPCVLCA